MSERPGKGRRPSGDLGQAAAKSSPVSPGKQSLVDQARAKIQMKRSGEGKSVHAAAERGTQGSGEPLPFLSQLGRLFGRHDVSGVQAFVGGAAKSATDEMGAEAYASGNKVAFGSAPSLHTAAHEAAHVVQQRAAFSSKMVLAPKAMPTRGMQTRSPTSS